MCIYIYMPSKPFRIPLPCHVFLPKQRPPGARSQLLGHLAPGHLQHLGPEITRWIRGFFKLFMDVRGRYIMIYHDISKKSLVYHIFSIEWHDAGFSADELMIEFLCVNVDARRSHRAEQKYPCGFNHHARKWTFSTFHFLVLLPVWCKVCWHQPGSSGHHETASTQLSLPSSQASSVGLDESPHGDVRPNPSHFRRRLFVVVDSCGGAVVHSSTQERKADRS